MLKGSTVQKAHNNSVAVELLFVRLNCSSNWNSSFFKESNKVDVTDLTEFW